MIEMGRKLRIGPLTSFAFQTFNLAIRCQENLLSLGKISVILYCNLVYISKNVGVVDIVKVATKL